jgi:hypothetical protein
MHSLILCSLLAPSLADEPDDLLRGLKDNPAAARMAWDKLVARGPAILPRILEAMDTPDVAAANWLRTAFERIVEKDSKNVDVDALRKFAVERKHQGRARRLALDTAEELRPGSRDKLLRDAIDDPEFRFDAIELAIKNVSTEQSIPQFRKFFEASRDLEQARRLQTKLKSLGVEVSVADHLGFLRQWHVIGPFDAKGMKGFTSTYPPEMKVDLQATYDGKDGKKLTWKRYDVKETTTGRHAALVDLRQPLGDSEDAVGFAYTTIKVASAGEVEFRGAADDNFTIWVNGKRVFSFEEYRNGVRLDRHRFKVRLEAGNNNVLVKVCQAPKDATNTEPNWEFLLRICDETGKGIAFTPALP